MEVTQPIVVVEEQPASSEGNPFILFILFVLTLAIHYLIPLLGTIYSKSQYNKWIAYWILLLALNAVAKPVFCFILGANGGAFITFSAGAGLLFFCKENRAELLTESVDIGLQLFSQVKQMGCGLVSKYLPACSN